jgi:hypothetical protein
VVMADILIVVGIIAFVAAMLWLVFSVGRV